MESMNIDPSMPQGWYSLTVRGLPGHPKTAVAVEGRDLETGEIRRVAIDPNPERPSESLPMFFPTTIPYTRVVSADEAVDEITNELNERVVGELHA